MIKKFLVYAVFMLFFLNVNIVYADSNEMVDASKIIDVTPPEITSISKDKNSVTAPGTLGITIKATDDISGIKLIYLEFYNEQYDSYAYAFINEECYDITTNSYNINIEVSKFTLPGTYRLIQLIIDDNAGNNKIYQDDLGHLDLSYIVENDIIDATPPEVISISKDKNSVTAPGTLGINVKATDDISGINYVSLKFYNEQYDSYLYASVREDNYIQSTDSYSVDIEIGKYTLPGTYKLNSIKTQDNAGNYSLFDSYDNNLSLDLSFIVENDIIDIAPPEIISISIPKDKTSVTAPDKLGINIKATDDASGINYIYIEFYNEEYDSYIAQFIDEYKYDEITDSYNSSIQIDYYTLPGTYKLNRIDVLDKANNFKNYDTDSNTMNFDLSFTVENNESIDLVTSTKNPNLANAIKNTENGSTILIVCESDSKISSDVFEAIMGTDKKIILQKLGYQWIFNGKDIKNPSTVDLNIEIRNIKEYQGNSYAQINSIFKDRSAFVVYLENNDTLPGKALLRIKADNWNIESIGSKNLYAYYYDTTTNKMILVRRNVNATTDKYIEFEVTNNNVYVVSNSDLYKNDNDNSDSDDNNSGSIINSRSSSSNNVFSKLDTAKNGDTITLKMNSDTKIPYSVLKTVKDKDMTLILEFKNYYWTIQGKNIDLNSLENSSENSLIDVTLKINDNTDENQVINFATLHEKDYPFKATLNIDIPKQYANEKLYLYRQTNGNYEYVSDINVDDKGNINVNIDKGGKFIIVKTKLDNKDSLENTLHVNQFKDIENHWAKDSIIYLTNKNILCGTSVDTFEPDENMTRAMFITTLGRIADVDISGKESTFSDTVKDSWYDGYVAYAYENNIINGIGDNNFAPNRPITREEMAEIIAKFSNVTGIELYQTNELVEFNDSEQISPWAKDSVNTIKMAGIIKGKPNNLFDPKANTTRAEASVVLENISNLYNK